MLAAIRAPEALLDWQVLHPRVEASAKRAEIGWPTQVKLCNPKVAIMPVVGGEALVLFYELRVSALLPVQRLGGTDQRLKADGQSAEECVSFGFLGAPNNAGWELLSH